MKQADQQAGIDKAADQVCFGDPKMPLAVLVTTSPWAEPPRMRHHLCRQLQKRFNVLYVTVGDQRSPNLWEVVGKRLICASAPRLGGVSQRAYSYNPLVHRRVNLQCATSVGRCVSRVAAERIVLVNFMWDFPELLDLQCWDSRVYVCCDEFPGMWRCRRIRHRLVFAYRRRLGQAYENAVARKADLCLTPHHAIRDKLARHCHNTRTLYHANDFTAPRLPGPSTRNQTSDTVINVAFMGYLHYRLLDSWLRHVVGADGMKLHLIGPVHEGYDLSNLGPRGAWTHHGTVVGEELQQLLEKMDVLVMPYDPRIPEVRILSSASKLFQYIGSLKPVVVSALPDLLDFPEGVIYRANNQGHFVEQIRRAVAEDCEEFRQARMKTAMDNSWDKRGSELMALLEPMVGELDSTCDDV